jgi:hypothetical protein
MHYAWQAGVGRSSVSSLIRVAVFLASGGALMKLLINEGKWNGFDFYCFKSDRIDPIIRNFFGWGEGLFGRRPHNPNDPVNLPARAFTHCRFFRMAEPYLSFHWVGKLLSQGRRVLSIFFI